MLIGGCMNKRSLVNGVVVSRRKKGDRIALWTGHKEKGANIEIWYSSLQCYSNTGVTVEFSNPNP